jgi:tRNA threonylcarbamoyladenosine biosynthesis protein TsaE
LVQVYERDVGPVWHFDLYRIGQPEELWELGWEEALAGGIVLVEWPQRAGALLPGSALVITLASGSGDGRQATLSGPPPWDRRLAGLELHA